MWNVLSPRVCRESATSLQAALNDMYPIHHTIKINWGNSDFSLHNPVEVFGNKTEAVARSANKHTFFALARGLGTVPVVNTYLGPCFQHRDALGHDGRGVVYVDKAEDFLPGYLSTQKIEGEEYRVYFCFDAKPIIYKKVPLVDGYGEVHNSTTHGYDTQPNLKKIPGLRKVLTDMTKAVANRLELSMGAVDFIVDSEHTCWVLESNSGPTLLSQELLEMFASAIGERYV